MDETLTPSMILQELAENVAVQIERNAPVAFDSALKEMTDYHRFLLQLNSPANATNRDLNYSEISGDNWRAPHEEWLGLYRRLFERAANRIPDDGHFIRSLAYAPHKLLPGKGDLPISQEVTKGIIDLGPLMLHMIETWVSKSTEVRKALGDEKGEYRSMIGSKASAYSDFLPHAISAWEYLLQKATYIYDWSSAEGSKPTAQWEVYRDSWPFIWQHLVNTARCLCISVWNEDEIAASFFREALVRWPKNLLLELGHGTGLAHSRLPFPEIMSSSWPDAKTHGKSLRSRLFRNLEAPEPRDLFSITVQGAFEDVLFVTSTVLLSWTSLQKQPTDIAARTASALLQRQTDEHHRPFTPNASFGFKELFLQALRLNLAGARWEEVTYGAKLDRLIGSLDRMTERTVVPGRIFTPTTLDSRHELVPTIAAILAAYVPEDGDDGLGQHVEVLAKSLGLLPDGDSSLRGVLDELNLIKTTLEENPDELVRGALGINPVCDTDAVVSRLVVVVEEVQTAISEIRDQRLRDTPIDQAKIQRIEAKIQDALLDAEGYNLYFQDFQTQVHADGVDHVERFASFQKINKATLTSPQLEPPSSGFESMLASGVKQFAGNFVWQEFTKQARTPVSLDLNVTNEDFWDSIKKILKDVGSNPVLVVSGDGEGNQIGSLRYTSPEELPNLDINFKQGDQIKQFYLATIEGIDIYSADFPAGTAWLFSAKKLKRVRYADIQDSDKSVEVTYLPKDEKTGQLKVQFFQQIDWSEGTIYEIKKPTSEKQN